MLHRACFLTCVLSLCAGASRAALVTLSGDLGSNSWAGAAFSPIGSPTVTTAFTQTFANGTVSGDAVAMNPTGFNLTLRLTNLAFTTFTPGVNNLTEIVLAATHTFQISAGTFFANHNLTGTWSTAVGNLAQLNTTVDLTGATPGMIQQIILVNTAGTTGFASSSPAIGGATTSIGFTIQMNLRLRIDGVGTTTLPSSADVEVAFIPAPGPAALLAIAGLGATRRRR